MASCGTSNNQWKCMNLKQIGFIDDKYINLATVYLKHNRCISTITEIIPVFFPASC